MRTNYFYSLLVGLSFIILNESNAAERIRKIELSADDIATVRTALGIATIIQVPDRPSSVVCGDQDAFKVEYLDQAITIKPLSIGSKSNLYIYTDWRRYNVQLISGLEANADYIVYLKPKGKKPITGRLNKESVSKNQEPIIKLQPYEREVKSQELVLKTLRFGRLKDKTLAIEFTLTSSKKLTLDPSWFWITQKGKSKPIHNLILTSFDCRPEVIIQGSIHIQDKDVHSSEPIRLELRRNQTVGIVLPKVALWK